MQSQLSQVLHILQSTKYLIQQQVRQKIAIFHESLIELVEINFRDCWINVLKRLKQKENALRKLQEERLQKFNRFNESILSLRRNQSNLEIQSSYLLWKDRTDLKSGVLADPRRDDDCGKRKIVDPSKLAFNKENQSHPQLGQLDIEGKTDTSKPNQKQIVNAFHSSECDPQNSELQIRDQFQDSTLSNLQLQTETEPLMHSHIEMQQDIIREQSQQKVEKVQFQSQAEGNSSSPPDRSSIGINYFSPANSRDNTAFGKECSKYEKKITIERQQYVELLDGISTIQMQQPVVAQSKSNQKLNPNQLEMILQMQMDSISMIDDSTQISEEQSYRKHQVFAMLREWPSTYIWVIHLYQKKYQINFTFYDDKKGEYGNFNDQLNRLLEKYLKNQNLFRMFFQVISITLTKKMHLRQRNKLMNIKWMNLQNLIIYDDNNWCGWLQDFSFLNPVFQNDGKNLKIVEFHLDFLFPQYIEFLTQFSFTFKVEIYIKHMTQETFLMLKKTKFINPDKINIIFKLNKLQIEQLMKLEYYKEQQNFNIQILQSIDLKQVQFFYSLMKLDMQTFYDKCTYIKREYLSSLQLSPNLTDIRHVQSQIMSIQGHLKQIYNFKENHRFSLWIPKKMELQFLFTKFEWNEVYSLTINNNLSYDAWKLFQQNSHNFINLTSIQLQYAYFQLQLVEAEHLTKFNQLEYLEIAEGILCKQRHESEQDFKDQMEEEEGQYVEVKKFNLKRLKFLYQLNLKLPHIQVFFKPQYCLSQDQIIIQEASLKELYDSTQQIINFYKWLRFNVQATLGYQVKTNADYQNLELSLSQIGHAIQGAQYWV